MTINSKMLAMFGQGGAMFGVEMLELEKKYGNIIAMSSDVSTPAGMDKFKTTFPDKFINFGIAESNMIGTAAGLSEEGFKTIAVAQACFMSMRCFEQVRQYVGYMQIPQILIGIGSGFSLSFMGNTHYALEDIALMKTVPGLNVIAPCDALQAMEALRSAVESNQPTYIRLFGGTGTPVIYQDECEFKIGKANVLIPEGDIQIIATGSMVSNAISVALQLKKEGINASVVDMHTIKPLDTEVIDMNTKAIVTVEEHRKVSGLGSSVADYLAAFDKHPKLVKIGVEDKFSPVGDYNYLLEQNGLSVDKIVSQIKSIKF